jgi:hypothetical protein
MDVTNPGVVSVASETYGNPDPNGGVSEIVLLPSITLVPAANYGHPPANNGVDASVFPTPAEVDVDQLSVLPPMGSAALPPVPNVNVDDQVIGQGTWQYADPANHALGKVFVEPADFIVVGPADSFQTNATEVDSVTLTVTAVYDADNLFHAPGPNTTRYYLVVGAPALTSYPVSLLGRQVVFADDSLTGADRGAARFITGYGTNFLVINRDDPTPSNGDVPTLAAPQVGDTMSIDVNRQASEQVNTTALPTANVVISPPPPVNVPFPAQGYASSGTTDVSTGPQPSPAPLTSGDRVPRSSNSNVIDQPAPNLPANVFV